MFLNGTCLYAGDIAIAIMDGKEDGTGNHYNLKCPSYEFRRNRIQSNGDEDRDEE